MISKIGIPIGGPLFRPVENFLILEASDCNDNFYFLERDFVVVLKKFIQDLHKTFMSSYQLSWNNNDNIYDSIVFNT